MYTFRYGRWSCAPAFSTACSHTRAGRRAATEREAASSSHLMYNWHDGRILGVRRPLRYLTWKLDLSDQQVRELADVLKRLKTARSQTQVDWDGSVADIADTFTSTQFDEDKAQAAVDRRKLSASAQQDQIVEALRRLHAILDEDQRAEFAYLLRSGSVEI